MRLILLGGPGAGKGTQAAMLNEKYNLPILGTGAIFRKAMKEDSEIGRQIKAFMDAGELVPDVITIKVAIDSIQKLDYNSGFILDGFPRTITQAKALIDNNIEIDRVIAIHVDEDEIVERLSGRLYCRECNSTYHIKYKPPKVDGVCDICSGELYRRDDDKPDTIKHRIHQYETDTKPLIDFYKNLGILRVVIGQDKIEDTTKLTLAALEGLL